TLCCRATGSRAAVDAEPARVGPGLFAKADDQGRRALATDRADVPETERLRPRLFPRAEIEVTEVTAQADARVARRRVTVQHAVVARHLHVELGLEPPRHPATAGLRRAQTPVPRITGHPELRRAIHRARRTV